MGHEVAMGRIDAGVLKAGHGCCRNLRLQIATYQHLIFLEIRLDFVVFHFVEVPFLSLEDLLAEISRPKAAGHADQILASRFDSTPLGQLEPLATGRDANRQPIWRRNKIEVNSFETMLPGRGDRS